MVNGNESVEFGEMQNVNTDHVNEIKFENWKLIFVGNKQKW